MASPVPSTDIPPSPKDPLAVIWEWLACFRSIKLAIVLLSLLAVGVLVGVFLPQEGLVETVQIKKTYGESYRVMKAMGFFNVYSSYWFIAIEVLFFFNLLFGSFQWLKPAFLSATRKFFLSTAQMAKTKEHALLLSPHDEATTLAQLKNTFKKHRYGVYANPEAPTQTYATKGNFSRFGPVIAHLGILMMLIASVYGAFTGFKAQQIAMPGSTFNLMQVGSFTPNVNAGIWQGTVPNWQFSVDDFRIEFYPDHPETVKQYFCNLKLKDARGKLLAQKVISVNDPLSHEDLTIYQATFTPTGRMFMEVNGRPVTFQINSTFGEQPISVTPISKDLALLMFPFFVQQGAKANNVRIMLQMDGKVYQPDPKQMPPNLQLKEGESGEFAGLKLKYIRPEYATGLQIKKAPEVPWMYLSFGIIMLGTILCIFSQRQLWASVRPLPNGQGTAVYILHKTNKARASFFKELARMETALHQQWPKPTLDLEPLEGLATTASPDIPLFQEEARPR